MALIQLASGHGQRGQVSKVSPAADLRAQGEKRVSKVQKDMERPAQVAGGSSQTGPWQSRECVPRAGPFPVLVPVSSG